MVTKASHIVISLVLLIATTGMAVSRHFCADYLVSTSIFADTEPCCGDEPCCHDESEFVQLEEIFNPAETAQLPHSAEIDLIAALTWQHLFIDSAGSARAQYSERKPPNLPDCHTFLSLKQSYLL